MNNFIQKGRTLTATLATAVTSGQLVLLGNGKLPAVASGTYAAGVEGEYNTSGVYEFPSATTGTAVVGDVAYQDSESGVITVTAAENAPVGHFAAPKAAADATARVRLWL
jgi:predicted RecA/RadA family phage recombinase